MITLQRVGDEMKIEAVVAKDFDKYYCICVTDDGICHNYIITEYILARRSMGVELQVYRQIMIEKYNAKLYLGGLYFQNKVDVLRAINEYIVPAIVMKILANS